MLTAAMSRRSAAALMLRATVQYQIATAGLTRSAFSAFSSLALPKIAGRSSIVTGSGPFQSPASGTAPATAGLPNSIGPSGTGTTASVATGSATASRSAAGSGAASAVTAAAAAADLAAAAPAVAPAAVLPAPSAVVLAAWAAVAVAILAVVVSVGPRRSVK